MEIVFAIVLIVLAIRFFVPVVCIGAFLAGAHYLGLFGG